MSLKGWLKMYELKLSSAMANEIFQWLEIAKEACEKKEIFSSESMSGMMIYEISELLTNFSKLCELNGHHVINDQCGLPEHRMCLVCEAECPDMPLYESINESTTSNQIENNDRKDR